MAKKELRRALGTSLRAEEQTLKDRFAAADAFLEGRDAGPPPPAPPREKVVRDGFSMPAGDYALIAAIQETCLQAGFAITKSEVLRAGLHALRELTPEALKERYGALEKVKPGRPGKSSSS
jgi:hypothetical protein